MEIGVVGLPFSGKTTLFSTLTGMDINLTHTGKVETHRGVVKVPDARLEKLTEIINPKKQTYTTIEYVEVGGLESKDVDKKGFDSQFLQVLKTTDALCLVVQAFQEEAVPHPSGSIDPARDIQLVESEFLLSDLSILENRLARLEKQIMQNKTDEAIRERDLLLRCQTQLEQEKPLREVDFTDDEKSQIKGFQFLSAKPLLIVINYGESDITRENEMLDPFFLFKQQLTMTSMKDLKSIDWNTMLSNHVSSMNIIFQQVSSPIKRKKITFQSQIQFRLLFLQLHYILWLQEHLK